MQGIKIISKSGNVVSADEVRVANQVATMCRGKNLGHIRHLDTATNIVVEYFPFKNLAIVQGGNAIFFGFEYFVEMRCPCKKIQFHEWQYVDGEPTRASVFLSDGTELASIGISSDSENYYDVFFGNNWWGGDKEALTNRGLIAGLGGGYQNGRYLNFEVPEDACYPISALYFMNVIKTVDPITFERIVLVNNTVTNPNIYQYKGMYFRSTSFTPLNESSLQQIYAFLDDVVIPGKQAAKTRETNRRYKCSQSQQVLLRNGFLPPEFEFFIKTQHPKSIVVRQENPIQVITGPTYELVSEGSDNGNPILTFDGHISMKYLVNVDGQQYEKQEKISGSVTVTIKPGQRDYVYTNFPIVSSISGAFVNPPGLPSIVQFPFNFGGSRFFEQNTHISDSNLHGIPRPLIYVIDGDAIASNWSPDTSLANQQSINDANYDPSLPLDKSVNNLQGSHPQFIKEYLRDSKVIESEINLAGTKVPVTPSSNWITSRLQDEEIITIVPLNFIDVDNNNLGMFPLDITDETGTELIIEKLRIHGYAEFQYNFETSSFSFIKWIEFANDSKVPILFDDEIMFDNGMSPTSITIEKNGDPKSYQLTPIEINYDMAWGISNCVCIGNKISWSDVIEESKSQKKNISDNPPAGYELTDAERLYQAVRRAIK